ncbi:MAG: type II toxin-antitoxin system VapC family toxin [Thermodesulfovibrionales bacterium]|nr:type II toxin-antitoxin system VapC family toxin [Thermodesulfovibrionales bacterium]
MNGVLIDTDIAIDYLRGNSKIRDFIFDLWDNNKAYLSILTVYELYAGMREEEKEYTENFINACNIDFLTMEITKKAGELFREYRKKGITITSIDCLINATAIINAHKIATNNVTHYPNEEILLSY